VRIDHCTIFTACVQDGTGLGATRTTGRFLYASVRSVSSFAREVWDSLTGEVTGPKDFFTVHFESGAVVHPNTRIDAVHPDAVLFIRKTERGSDG
jgi:hypothetical protein